MREKRTIRKENTNDDNDDNDDNDEVNIKANVQRVA